MLNDLSRHRNILPGCVRDRPREGVDSTSQKADAQPYYSDASETTPQQTARMGLESTSGQLKELTQNVQEMVTKIINQKSE